MAADVQEIVRELLMNALESSGKKASDAAGTNGSSGSGPLSGMKGVVAGAGAAALLPLAAKNVAKHIGGLEDLAKSPGGALGDVASKLGDSVGGGIGDKVSGKLDESGGPSGILKDAVKGALPFGGGDDDDSGGNGGVAGVGKGRRMPVQQSV